MILFLWSSQFSHDNSGALAPTAKKRLSQVPGIEPEEDWVGRYPSIALSNLDRDENLTRFLDVLDWSVAEVPRVNQ